MIAYLIRPGLRDRLVFEYKKYTSTGDFSAAFVENFHFHWPFSERDIFAFNPVSQKYEVSKVFLEYAYNFKVSQSVRERHRFASGYHECNFDMDFG